MKNVISPPPVGLVLDGDREWMYLVYCRGRFESLFKSKFPENDESVDRWFLRNEGWQFGVDEFRNARGLFDVRLALDSGWVYVSPFYDLEFLISVDFLDRMRIFGVLP